MDNYLMGSDILGAWGQPVVVTADFGSPIYVHGSDVLGMFDIADKQHQMNALKQVPVSVALILLRYGQQAINGAVNGAKQPWYKSDLPGQSKRAEVAGKLQWHAGELAKYAATPNVMYPSGDDLKKWVMQSFIEANAVEEGAAYISDAWLQMWSEIGTAIANLPKTIAKAVGDAAGDVVKNVTGLPIWAWGLIGVGATTLLGFFVYKLANSRAGGAVAGVAARRYLP